MLQHVNKFFIESSFYAIVNDWKTFVSIFPAQWTAENLIKYRSDRKHKRCFIDSAVAKRQAPEKGHNHSKITVIEMEVLNNEIGRSKAAVDRGSV